MDMIFKNILETEPQVACEDVFIEKYAKDGEKTRDEVFKRVAKGLAQAENTSDRKRVEKQFYSNMLAGAVGAGRIMSAAGTEIKATLANCFVQPVGDCIQGVDADGYPGIYESLRMAAETMRRGGGVGYDFSRIRPKGAMVKGTHSEASGPCSYMDVFDASCRTVESAGSRRGAQMGILRIDHPDVLEFISAKRTPGRWNNFNVSVGVIDAFMEACEAGKTWDLVHAAEPSQSVKEENGAYQRADGKWVYKIVPAREILDAVMGSTYDFAEPGIVFLDNMNRDNNLRYTEVIEATNPCGEEPLPKYGCCDLGPINLTRFVANPFGFEESAPASFEWDRFAEVVKVQTRLLDNVLSVTMWPLDEQRIEAENKRRIGVGYSGLGDALVMLGLRYDSQAGRDMAAKITSFMANAAYQASVELAKERGAFPLFDADKYLEEGTFASRLPEETKQAIRQFGIRNSHLTAIAPVGTISLAFFDNVSNGIEPAFSWSYNRKKRMADGTSKTYPVEDHAFRAYLDLAVTNGTLTRAMVDNIREAMANGSTEVKTEGGAKVSLKEILPESFVAALEMSAQDHLLMMAAVQPFIDSSISKTVNVPADYPFQDFKNLYFQAWKAGLKGLATYRPNPTLGAVLSVPTAEQKPVDLPVKKPMDVDPLQVNIPSRPAGALPAVTEKITYYTKEGKKSTYAVVSFAPVKGVMDGVEVTIQRPIEFFIPTGQEGESQQWVTAAMRSLSLAARGGFVARALQDLRKVPWDKGDVRSGTKTRMDGTNIPLYHASEVAAIGYALQQILVQQGFLDVDGNQVPTKALISKAPQCADELESNEQEDEMPFDAIQHGKKCHDCGAHAVIRRDGCEFCTACGAVGSCG